MKRFLIIIILPILALSFLRCGRKQKKLVFSVGGAPHEIKYWKKLVSDFEEQTGIQVDLVRQPTDTDQRRQSLVIPLKGKRNNPDVFLMDVAWVKQFAASQWLHPLDARVKKSKFNPDKLFAPVLNQVDNYNNNLIALPVYVDCGLLYYRKDLLNKYDYEVPRTWRQLVDCARDIQSKVRPQNEKFYGYVWQGAQYEGLVCNFLEFVTANNGRILENGEAVVNSEANLKALKFMEDLINKYEISPQNVYTEMKEEQARKSFQQGNALFERNWPYAWELHQSKESSVKGKVGVAMLPKFKGGQHTATLGGWHLGISKFSDTKDESWKLVKYILSYETQKKLALNLGYNPSRRDIYEDPEIKSNIPHAPVLKKAMQHIVARPTVPSYTQISSILQNQVNSVLSGNIEPEKALKKAQKKINNTLKIYNE